MAPKKAPKASADGEPEDISCELLMKNYRKNCLSYQIEVNKQIRTAFDNDWVENFTPIKKVSLHFVSCVSFTCGMKSVGKELEV